MQRKKLYNWIFKRTIVIPSSDRKNTLWDITTKDLLLMPFSSFDYQLGKLVNEQNSQLKPKVVPHDAYHLLTGFGTDVEDKIALQYHCFGNGKRNPYLTFVLVIGTLILPEFIAYYLESFRIGKSANSFHHFDFRTILPINFTDFRSIIFSEKQRIELQQIQMQIVKYNLKTIK
jgi:hypothetical protein